MFCLNQINTGRLNRLVGSVCFRCKTNWPGHVNVLWLGGKSDSCFEVHTRHAWIDTFAAHLYELRETTVDATPWRCLSLTNKRLVERNATHTALSVTQVMEIRKSASRPFLSPPSRLAMMIIYTHYITNVKVFGFFSEGIFDHLKWRSILGLIKNCSRFCSRFNECRELTIASRLVKRVYWLG